MRKSGSAMSGAWPLILRGVFICSWNIAQWFREAHPHPGKLEHVGPLLRIINALRTGQAVECLSPVFSSPPAHWDSSSSFSSSAQLSLGCPVKVFLIRGKNMAILQCKERGK